MRSRQRLGSIVKDWQQVWHSNIGCVPPTSLQVMVETLFVLLQVGSTG
jgi:hypothetical protein